MRGEVKSFGEQAKMEKVDGGGTMTLTINLPQDLESRLEREASTRQLSIEEIALDILDNALSRDSLSMTPQQVVAKIQSTPPNAQSIRVASGSLADALRAAPSDPEFDLDQWNAEWAAVEAEMKTITRENDIAEGRG